MLQVFLKRVGHRQDICSRLALPGSQKILVQFQKIYDTVAEKYLNLLAFKIFLTNLIAFGITQRRTNKFNIK